ncbi:MAG: hypothetical protein HN580_28845 [Deltaproteobacteria bacterium]|jgi:hypothetical protein|nr:hypothetical protein [Deltaproteobacteria bacterium]MBT4268619.1 hypothetical protein [Deltaproteobacteria bacterium]MBT4642710.1 hypothetical protein [Deltaproteobacteria bacterium]MBT6501986.1 hypothetical protein [Deltaproteobacteria bacterium]MBT7154975.1 hypothetical protein [Deltaproteobacteria bacterium]
MEFPSMAWITSLQKKCNESSSFRKASSWADTKIVLEIGDSRYYLKLYRGEIIDIMEYLPFSNALGYDILLRGQREVWQKIIERQNPFLQLAFLGEIERDGNMLECNRMHEAVSIMTDEIMPQI